MLVMFITGNLAFDYFFSMFAYITMTLMIIYASVSFFRS